MKKGFTLIELLAVIVILAILALIATPIVLSIIDDSKESSTIRSAEGYLRAVEYEIARAYVTPNRITEGTFNVLSGGNICIDGYSNNTCSGKVLEIEYNNEGPVSGSITLEEAKITHYTLTYPSGITVVDGKVGDEEELSLTLGETIIKKAKDNNYYYTTTPDFSKVTEDGEYGLYQAPDDLGTSYYFRGDTEDNYVQFGNYSGLPVKETQYEYEYYYNDGEDEYTETRSGFKTYEECQSASNNAANANSSGGECYPIEVEKEPEFPAGPMYWRIIRINGDGTIRMIYDGQEKVHNGVEHNAIIGSNSYSAFSGGGNNFGIANAYYTKERFLSEGYMDEYEYLLTPNSFAITFVDRWYELNLKNGYEQFADVVFCNDIEYESIQYEEGDFLLGFEEWPIGSMFAPYKRNINENPYPSFKCLGSARRNTVSLKKGTGTLNYPISLITVDELVSAGNIYAVNNKTNYLYSGEDYWTISPAINEPDMGDNLLFYTNTTGQIRATKVDAELGLRPVINLKADVEFTGDGSFDNPYVIVTE